MTVPTAEAFIERPSRPRIVEVAQHLLRHPVGVIGLVLVGLFLFAAAAAPLISPYEPNAMPSKRRLEPGAQHWLGTDNLGRDVWSRIVHGSRVSLRVGIISVGIALMLGGSIGLMSGYYLGWFDTLVQRIVDIMFAFPTVILIITIAGVVGPSIETAMIAIGIVYSPQFARIARGPTLSVMRQQYVEGARAVGVGEFRVMTRYVLPNIAAPIIVQATLSFSTAVLAEATLSFLGLGTQPPDPSWGTMLNEGRSLLELAPWVAIWPGVAIAVVVLGLNMLGDALRDALDPRLKQL